MTPASEPTVVVELTPPGRAAVAVVLVAGPEAVRAVDGCFTPMSSRPLGEVPIGRISLGRWGGVAGEELIACRRSDEQIEIHCHGGTAAVQSVIDRLIDRGCCQMSWQDWLRSTRRRVSPKLATASRRDAATCAAEIALAEAPTARTAGILLDQYHGALTLAIEAAAAAVAAADWPRAGEIIDGVVGFRDLGLHLTAAWRVVLAGAPNVGKSSLINALAGYQRAIVSPVPGTTRDVVTLATAIDGWPVQLADTAGLRVTHDELESAGVALAAATLANADLVIVVHEATEHAGKSHVGDREAASFLSELPNTVCVLEVCNKIDLVDAADRPGSCTHPAIATSAVTGEGIAGLVAAIGRTLVPAPPPTGAAVPFTAEQLLRLDAARAAIERCDALAAESVLKALLAR